MMIGDIIISFKEDMVRTKNWLIKAYLENTCKHDYKIVSFNSSHEWRSVKNAEEFGLKRND
ncbi:hypothetical protein KQ236_15435 [Lactococcus lactis]|nr:hypothetical protein [Lactococcus lactis]